MNKKPNPFAMGAKAGAKSAPFKPGAKPAGKAGPVGAKKPAKGFVPFGKK